MQGRIESGKDPRPPKCPRHFDGRPGWGGRQPTGDVLQRRTHSLVNYQPGRRPQPNSGIENVNGICVLEIEAVSGGGRAHAWDSTLSHEQIKGGQPTVEIRCSSGIYAVPDTNQATLLNLPAQLPSPHHR